MTEQSLSAVDNQPKFTVGQRVWLSDVNMRKDDPPEAGEVVKVGRKLVTVKGAYWSKTFRIDDGRANDNYGHQWIETDAERAEREHRRGLLDRCRAAGIEFKFGNSISTRVLERIAAVLDEA